MSRVLLIDDDAVILLSYKGILRVVGHEVSATALGEDGVYAACRNDFDVVLCDYRLPDLSGVEVVRQIRDRSPRTAIVLVTAWGTPEVIANARRAGATMYAMKPLSGDDLTSVVQEALRLKATAPDDPELPGYAARRWVDLITRGVHMTDDPRTVGAWCKAIGIARGTLQKRCEAVQVTPKDSLDFLRLLRLSIRHAGEPWDLQYHLDITDIRTARALIQRAGFGSHAPCVPTLECFLLHQQLICAANLIVAVRPRLVAVLAL